MAHAGRRWAVLVAGVLPSAAAGPGLLGEPARHGPVVLAAPACRPAGARLPALDDAGDRADLCQLRRGAATVWRRTLAGGPGWGRVRVRPAAGAADRAPATVAAPVRAVG